MSMIFKVLYNKSLDRRWSKRWTMGERISANVKETVRPEDFVKISEWISSNNIGDFFVYSDMDCVEYKLPFSLPDEGKFDFVYRGFLKSLEEEVNGILKYGSGNHSGGGVCRVWIPGGEKDSHAVLRINVKRFHEKAAIRAMEYVEKIISDYRNGSRMEIGGVTMFGKSGTYETSSHISPLRFGELYDAMLSGTRYWKTDEKQK